MQFIGFMAILLIGSMVVRVALDGLQNPAVTNAIAVYSPFVAEHSTALAWASALALMIVVLMIPVKLMTKAAETGEDSMETIGAGVVGGLQGLAVAVAILSVGYLAGAGWLIATTH